MQKKKGMMLSLLHTIGYLLRLLQSVTEPLESGQWRTVTEGVIGKYCQSYSPSLIIGNQFSDKYIISKDLDLSPGDVIQFKVRVVYGQQEHLSDWVLLNLNLGL